MGDLAELRSAALAFLRPPEKLQLSEWVERTVILPSAISAAPGPMRLTPQQRDIADSIGDTTVERVSVMKSVRVGYTQLLVSAIGHFSLNDPSPVLVVLPAESDARNLMIGPIEATFAASPILRGALLANAAGRDTMLHRQFPGGSLRLVSAGAPRNLRGHTARVLLLDEVDAFETDAGGEGDPVALAERRTLSYADRKIVMGSTPVDESTSRILRAYLASDRREFRACCPSCAEYSEIQWRDIQWNDAPETAHWVCPKNGCIIEEGEQKQQAIEGGRWIATAPEVGGHHGYKLNALS